MIIDDIRTELTAAMKARDSVTVDTLRSIIAAVQEAEVSGSVARTLDDDEVQKVIATQAKRRVEAAEAFDSGGAAERAAKERAELVVLERYLPKGLTEGELTELVESTLAENGFSERSQMGQAMKAVNAKVAGRADGRTVADMVKSRLS
ncbi:MAG: GatB/YqeY domain-containing protein [Actinomycetia bacterium]|nr:GatB/YqeY domain-containing protein [Actinomycetes bacterium]MCP4958029.1 GatB/YqeY domain-containing protein [Actinomycetes bacterium]